MLNKLPKSLRTRAKTDLHEIWLTETRAAALLAFDTFLAKYGANYEAARHGIRKDRDGWLAFYDFPAKYWAHLRTINPIESTFATIRLRSRRMKGSGALRSSLATKFKLKFKLARAAQKRRRRLDGHE